MTNSFRTLKLALAQANPVMGDIFVNLDKARHVRAEAARLGADLQVLPELYLVGYTPEDLVLKPAVQRDCRRAVEQFAADTADGGPAVLIGTPWRDDEGALRNAAVLLDGGAVAALRFKADLPNYSVFDEKRVFQPGPLPMPVSFRGVRLGLPVSPWWPLLPGGLGLGMAGITGFCGMARLLRVAMEPRIARVMRHAACVACLAAGRVAVTMPAWPPYIRFPKACAKATSPACPPG